MARSLRRRVAALITAYAIALQAVLTFGLALPSSAATIAALCVGLDNKDAPARPEHDGNAQCCLAIGCHGGPAIAPHGVAPEAARRPQRGRLEATFSPLIAALTIERASWPRGPPHV